MSFRIGEDVLAYHGPLLYLARIKQTSETESGEPLFYVHYDKWNKKFDEWVTTERLREVTPENVQLQSELKNVVQAQLGAKTKVRRSLDKLVVPDVADEFDERKDKKGKRLRERESSEEEEEEEEEQEDTTQAPPSKRQKKEVAVAAAVVLKKEPKKKVQRVDLTVFPDREVVTAPGTDLPLPLTLKCELYDEWVHITKHKKLPQVPCAPSCAMVLDEFLSLSLSQNTDSAVRLQYQEFVEDVKSLFDIAIPRAILYRYERPFFDSFSASHPGTRPSSVYGPHHLLRLFTRIPFMLESSDVPIGAPKIAKIRSKFVELVHFIDSRRLSCALFAAPFILDAAYAAKHGSLLTMATLLDTICPVCRVEGLKCHCAL